MDVVATDILFLDPKDQPASPEEVPAAHAQTDGPAHDALEDIPF